MVVRADALDPSWLGRQLVPEVIDELEAAGIDPCGELGEYHTVVTDGPRFAAPVRLVHGEQVPRSGCWVLDVDVVPGSP